MLRRVLRPVIDPARIVAVWAGHCYALDKASVHTDFANGWWATGTVRLDEYCERHVSVCVYTPTCAFAETPYADLSHNAFLLIGDIGHAVIDPTYLAGGFLSTW